MTARDLERRNRRGRVFAPRWSPAPVSTNEGPLSTGPLIVELAGTPGSGKTSIVEGVHAGLRDAGLEPLTPSDAAHRVVARSTLGRLVARVPSRRIRQALRFRIYAMLRLWAAGHVIARDPVHFVWLVRYQRRRPSGAWVRQRKVVHWLVRTIGAQEFIRERATGGEAVVFDEGCLHRVVQCFSSPVDTATPTTIRRYVDGVRRPHLLVAVRCPLVACLSRVRDRGVWERLSHLDPAELSSFVAHAAEVVDEAVAHVRVSGWRVVELDNGGSDLAAVLKSTRRSVRDAALGVLADAEPGDRPLYRLRMPRPDRLARTVASRLEKDAIPLEHIDELLGAFDLDRSGPVVNLPLGRRSNSVRVDTDAGRMVVRAYAQHWTEPAIRHEHSVLAHLEAVGYPATRLVADRAGDTVHLVGGRRLAMFRFARGVSLTGSFVSSLASREACHLLGRLLARLHRATAHLDPDGRHHLALVDADGHSRLDAQLLMLNTLARTNGHHPDAVWMRQRAHVIADRLAELHDVLAGTGPEIAIIHGDYGLHNVLLRRNGSAVVHDFELARRDWLLVDIVETLGAMRVAEGQAFLAGYRVERRSEPPDWRYLAEAWEYHRLGGAIRTWESFVRRGDLGRLSVARARVEEAARVAAEGVAQWL